MLPQGNIRAWQTRDNRTHFTKDEQFTRMPFGASPFGLDHGRQHAQQRRFYPSLLTNDAVLSVNQNSANNRRLFNTNDAVAWIADVPGTKDKYVALFNTSPATPRARLSLSTEAEGNGAISNTEGRGGSSISNEPEEVSHRYVTISPRLMVGSSLGEGFQVRNPF